MRSVGSSGRGVGTGLLGVPRRGRGAAASLAVVVLVGGLAAGGRVPSLSAPPRAPAPERGVIGGSDQISALIRQIRAVQAQIRTAEVRVGALTEQADQIASELVDATARRGSLTKDLKAARADESAAARAADAAASAHSAARKARKAATRELKSAQEALAEAQDASETAATAADRAADAVAGAEKKVRATKAGTKKRRTAFTSWQMAAISDRAAHARQVLADDRATDEFVGVQAAEAALAMADSARDQARTERNRARAAAESAADRVGLLTERRAEARSTVKALKAEESVVAEQLLAIRKSRKALNTRLADLEARAVAAQERLDGGTGTPSGGAS